MIQYNFTLFMFSNNRCYIR